MQRPLLLAHRGLHDDVVQENSLAALAAGAAQLDGVELDVRFSADGEAVIVHDETLDRLFGVARRVGDLSLAELMAIGVPRLREALTVMPADTLIDLELKELPTDALFAELSAVRGSEASGVVLSSFKPEVLYAIRDHAPTWPLWLNAESEAEAEEAVGIGCIGV
ncbi:MAG: glycerophosphodiester phosphodiesterase [Candidatus Limnocylindrus sp.]